MNQVEWHGLTTQAEIISDLFSSYGCNTIKQGNALLITREGKNKSRNAKASLCLVLEWTKHGDMIARVNGTNVMFPFFVGNIPDYDLLTESVMDAINPENPASFICNTRTLKLEDSLPLPALSVEHTYETTCEVCRMRIYYILWTVNGIVIEGDDAMFYPDRVVVLPCKCTTCNNETALIVRLKQ